MRWKSGRKSQNVEDRRAGGGKGKALGGGIGAIIMAIVAVFFFGKDPGQALQGLQQNRATRVETDSSAQFSAKEQELAKFASTVLAYTEDVWDEIFPAASQAFGQGRKAYRQPTLVLFSGKVQSRCGFASAASGPFYCPGDDKVYIDLSFYEELAQRFKAPGDFAQAYVLAHEVGHHVQNLLGFTRKVDSQRGRVSKEEQNRLSVRLELQADYFAGVWANRAEKKWRILERGDLEEGLGAAGAVGDDRIQMRSRGYVVPESFTHGTADQRIRWFTLGLKTGDPAAYDPFKVKWEEL